MNAVATEWSPGAAEGERVASYKILRPDNPSGLSVGNFLRHELTRQANAAHAADLPPDQALVITIRIAAPNEAGWSEVRVTPEIVSVEPPDEE